jgi:hypothetical protein
VRFIFTPIGPLPDVATSGASSRAQAIQLLRGACPRSISRFQTGLGYSMSSCVVPDELLSVVMPPGPRFQIGKTVEPSMMSPLAANNWPMVQKEGSGGQAKRAAR